MKREIRLVCLECGDEITSCETKCHHHISLMPALEGKGLSFEGVAKSHPLEVLL